MLCRNRPVLRLPQTATRCANTLIRACSTNTASATTSAKAGDDAQKPERTKRCKNGDSKSPQKFRARKPLYDSKGNLVPEGWTIDKETKQVRPIKKKPSQKGKEDGEATLLSNLVQDSDVGTLGSTAPPFVKDRGTGEWRLRRSKKGTTVKSLKQAAPELLGALEHAKAKKEEEKEAARRNKAQEEEERLAKRRARQAAREEKEKELELRRQAKEELQKQRAHAEQALKDARAAAKLAATLDKEKRQEMKAAQRKAQSEKTPEEKLAERAEKARVRNRLNRRKVRAEEKRLKEEAKAEAAKQQEAESAMAEIERISRETSEVRQKDLSGAQSKLATTIIDIEKRTSKTRRVGRPKKASKSSKSDVVPAQIAKPEPFAVVSDQSKSISERLEAAAPWKADPAKARRKAPKDLKDFNRVNIISEDLCDDIINYMGKDLDRHIGCDLLDLNPGVGIWSKKLNDRLQPRKHIMMEADADLYQPFMNDLLQKPNVHMINSTPYLWTELEKHMAEHLTEQMVKPSGTPKERNDTLLVTANIGWWPNQLLYRTSMGLMIAYQLVQAIHSSTLFQKYGNVRMLLWVDDHTRARLIPRQVHARRRSAFVAELATEWIHEIAGREAEIQEGDRGQVRDMWLDFESNTLSYLHMKAGRRQMPTHRMPWYHQQVLKSPELIGERLAGERVPVFRRNWYNDLAKLNKVTSEDLAANEKVKHKLYYLKHRSEREDKGAQGHLEAIQLYDRAIATYGTPEGQSYIDELLKTTGSWPKGPSNSFETVIDDYRLFRNPKGPQLSWDRRHLDPLRVHPQEYFPNVPMSLVDIQPKTMSPLLQQYGHYSTRSGDMSDLLLRSWFSAGKMSPSEAMTSMWHGFGEKEIIDQCPSFTDRKVGGVPLEFGSSVGHRVRTTTEQQWLEVLQAWMEWPFQPTYVEMVGQSVEESVVSGMNADDD